MTVTNKQIAKVFREAKKYLWDGSEEPDPAKTGTICFAIITARNNHKISVDECDTAREVIWDAIYPESSAIQWLIKRCPKAYYASRKEYQAWQHVWLDRLIVQFDGED